MTSDSLAKLSQAGVSIWLDDLSRPLLASGRLADLAAHDHVVGVTSGLDYAGIVQDLEDDGVRKFDASWQQLAATLRRPSLVRSGRPVAAGRRADPELPLAELLPG